ncbi:hypothetical protein PRUPE_7G034200 [Prunus persica]|uniref:Uncharacterized protein n=1 Tax=Prunus persica TaxID=3760 RepID=A0A251N662_PRUPE|nr:hypothetical protein PRUPE_7G034200 [Prunus persica]
MYYVIRVLCYAPLAQEQGGASLFKERNRCWMKGTFGVVVFSRFAGLRER